jgi:hypothetical protein
LTLIDSMTWGDLGLAIQDIDESLRRALRATSRDLHNWDNGDYEQRFGDEFWLTDAQVAGLSDEERFAYVARLIQTAAVIYGLWPGDRNSPAALLHGLDQLVDETLEERR